MNELCRKFLWIGKTLSNVMLVPVVLCIPKNRHKIVFGAWSGHSFSCNPKYLMEYVLRQGGYTCVWVGDKNLRESVLAIPGARFAVKGSLMALWHCLTAKFYAFNVCSYDDIIHLPHCHKTILLYLSHGYPDKRMGERQFNGNGEINRSRIKRGAFCESLRNLWVRLDHFMYGQEAWSSASSPVGDELRVLNMPWRLSMDRMLHAGTPRADYMIANASNLKLKKSLRKKLSKSLGISDNGKWVVFVPTWRHDPSYLYSFTTSSMLKEWQGFFAENNITVIEKQHPRTLRDGLILGGSIGNVCVVSADSAKLIDTQELLLASDLLITDYSSVYYDFYLMNRPVIHFTYDFEHAYTKDFGFDFDIREYGGGPFAYTEGDLMKFIGMPDTELLKLRNEKTKEHLTYETGHSCEAYYDLISRLSTKRNFFV